MSKAIFVLLAITAGVLASVMVNPIGRPPKPAKPSAVAETRVSPEARTEPVEPLPQPEIATATISRVPLPTQTAVPALDHASLARSLQRELKRVGCYHGEINGVRTASTRQAMKAFTELANARL